MIMTRPQNTIQSEVDATAQSEDVPVNRTTSFNGRLNQYFHVSKVKPKDNAPVDSEQATGSLKRKSASISTSTSTTKLDTDSHAKRRKPSETSTSANTMKPTPTTPQRITRSASKSLQSTPSASASPSPSPAPVNSTRPTRTRTRTTRNTNSPLKPTTQTTTTTTHSPPNLLRDSIPPNLLLLLVGVNPGLKTGATGYAYAHPSNLFWKLLHTSGITAIRHPPSDTYRLPELYSVGNTNIVERPTRDAGMLSRAEMDAGVPVLEGKVARQRPEVVALVGKSIWEAVWRVRVGRGIRKEEFRYGWQGEEMNMGRCEGWDGARVFVATTTSGLAAGMSLREKEAIWADLGRWIVKRREERSLCHSRLGI